MIEMTSVAPGKCELTVASLGRGTCVRPSRMFVDGVPVLTRTERLGYVLPIGAHGQTTLLLEPTGSNPVSLTARPAGGGQRVSAL